MTLAKTGPVSAQLPMPGMPLPFRSRSVISCCKVAPGQQVVYMGKVHGGPHYGALGIVKQALQRKAVVDMGKAGTWNIPYYFLTMPQAA